MTLTVILSYINLKSPISPTSAFRSSITKRIYCTPRKSPIPCNRLTPHVTCPFKLRGCFFLPLPLTILWKKQICPANLWDLKFEEVEHIWIRAMHYHAFLLKFSLVWRHQEGTQLTFLCRLILLSSSPFHMRTKANEKLNLWLLARRRGSPRCAS